MQVYVQLPTYADNAALPAFARHAVLTSAGRAAIDRILLPPGPQSKPAAAGLLLWARTGTDNSGGCTLGPGGAHAPPNRGQASSCG